MVNLTRIYTRTGDDGQTRLGDNSVASKTDARLHAFADVDEANSALGVALATSSEALGQEVTELLRRVQNDLFDVGADLSTPVRPEGHTYEFPPLRVTQEYVDALEQACDRFNAELAPLRSFVLPGGSPAAAYLHVARTVVRRAERAAWAAVEQYGKGQDGGGQDGGDQDGGDQDGGDQDGGDQDGGVNLLAVRYLNRLSDLLFILARRANGDAGDVLWQPGGGR